MASEQRIMLVGLDGFELRIGDRMLAEGRLPNLKKIRDQSANLLLDHGKAKLTGLAWEHVSTGMSPEDTSRWAAVELDTDRYGISQCPTSSAPFAAALDCRTVVFDAPYFDLARAPGVRGAVGWGAHDPGVDPAARPNELLEEIRLRFGEYPAEEWIYGFVWPYADRARRAADQLIEAVNVRADIAEWLFGERLPDWDLAYVVVGEFHSAVEAMWHGVDPDHPLHGLESAAAARKGLEGVYEATDQMLGRFIERFPDTRFVLFNLHGMGRNESDVASMALLSELLHRHAFRKPHLAEGNWPVTPEGIPLMTSGRGWEEEVGALFPKDPPPSIGARILRRLTGRPVEPGSNLDWMPAARYRRFWPEMPAFALPSFYDGRIRINLVGREAQGKVDPADYTAVCDALEALLLECRDPVTGQPAVSSIERARSDPMQLVPSDADLFVMWNGGPIGLEHPKLGRIGPFPYRRSGGHSGKDGFAHFYGEGFAPGNHGLTSAFDVVPTVVDLMGGDPTPFSGESVRSKVVRQPAREASEPVAG